MKKKNTNLVIEFRIRRVPLGVIVQLAANRVRGTFGLGQLGFIVFIFLIFGLTAT